MTEPNEDERRLAHIRKMIPAREALSSDSDEAFLLRLIAQRDERIRRLEAVVEAARHIDAGPTAQQTLRAALADCWSRPGRDPMTAPKWAMERAEVIIAGLTGEPDELVFHVHQDMAAAIANAHREGWQAAIEAGAREAERIEGHGECGHEAGYNDGRLDAAAAIRHLPYQPPEDRGDG